MRRLSLLTMMAGLLFVGLAGTAQAASTKTFHVKITNLTSGPPMTAGQPLSRPLWAVHDKKVDVWSVGELASIGPVDPITGQAGGVAGIAEDANNGPLQASLAANPHVLETRSELGGRALPAAILPGEDVREFDVPIDGNQKYLTLLAMLVRTNDAFVGLDSYKLNGAVGKTDTLLLDAYDGGTENNNEDCAFIPGCGNFGVRDETSPPQPIAPHPGITGGDIAAFMWTDPVARVEITRTQ